MPRRSLFLAAAAFLAATPLAAQAPIDRLGGQTFTLTANDDTCGQLVAAELERRLMKRQAKPVAGEGARSGSAPLLVTADCSAEPPRFRASITIAEASGTVLYKASGSTGAGFTGSQANFIASVVENIFVR